MRQRKFNYFTLPMGALEERKLKKLKVRLFEHPKALRMTKKHPGKGEVVTNKITGEVELDKKGRPKRRSCDLFFDVCGAMYNYTTNKDGVSKIVDKKITNEDALEKHPLKFTTSCGDQTSKGYSPDHCYWCKLYWGWEGIKTLKLRNFITGYIIVELEDGSEEVQIINLPKATLGEDLIRLHNNDAHGVWISIEMGKTEAGRDTWRAVATKTKVKDIDEKNVLLKEKYEIENDDIDVVKDPDNLRFYYKPKSEYVENN